MSGTLIIMLFIFPIAVMAALELIAKGNSLKPDFHEFSIKEKIFRKKWLPLRDMAKKLHLWVIDHSLNLVQEDFR
ncbi:hypothetical protein [Cyclobacterium jeungdonense]|uniref:Uncharacterized protein n=1 Tax=Cyclobacterium jeungdonense TaxID=708087 RepID=A0ABT8C9P8_9BACT|nr:hypothetical protein [Cyclobacterium jeungdonense]MDN3688396.1 hypothetical protein [Cyclobacterium jeungdonense]